MPEQPESQLESQEKPKNYPLVEITVGGIDTPLQIREEYLPKDFRREFESPEALNQSMKEKLDKTQGVDVSKNLEWNKDNLRNNKKLLQCTEGVTKYLEKNKKLNPQLQSIYKEKLKRHNQSCKLVDKAETIEIQKAEKSQQQAQDPKSHSKSKSLADKIKGVFKIQSQSAPALKIVPRQREFQKHERSSSSPNLGSS